MNLFPVAYAAEIAELTKVKKYILNPLIALIFALAIIYFLYGVFKFIKDFGEKSATEEGKKHMLWGIIGLAIMVSVYGLLNLLTETIKELAK